MGRGPVVAAKLIGVAGAQLALHFPDQIAEFAAGAHALDEGKIAGVDHAPIHFGHVLGPEVVALEPPCLPIHLLPFALGLDGELDPPQIDPACFAARAVLARGLLAGADDAHTFAAQVEQFLPVARQLEGVDVFGDGLGLVVLEHPGPQRPTFGFFLLHVVFTVQRAMERQHGEDRPPRRPGNLAVAAVGNWKRQHSFLDALQVDDQRFRFLVLFLSVAPRLFTGRRRRTRQLG